MFVGVKSQLTNPSRSRMNDPRQLPPPPVAPEPPVWGRPARGLQDETVVGALQDLPPSSQLRVLRCISQEVLLAASSSMALATPGEPPPAERLESHPSEVYSASPDLRTRPKRPANAFILWSSAERGRFHSGQPANYTSGMLRDTWNRMSEADKAPWRAKSRALFADFKLKYPDIKYHPPRKTARKRKRKQQKKPAEISTTVRRPSIDKADEFLDLLGERSTTDEFLGDGRGDLIPAMSKSTPRKGEP